MKNIIFKLLLSAITLGNSTTFILAQDVYEFGSGSKGWGINPEKSRPVCKVVGRARGIPEANWDFNFGSDFDTYLSKVQHCFPNDILSDNRCLEEAVFYRSQDECNAWNRANNDLTLASAQAGWPLSPILPGVCSGGDQWWDYWGYGCWHLANNMYYIATIGKLKQQLSASLTIQATGNPQGKIALDTFRKCVLASTTKTQIHECYNTALKILKN